MMKIHGSHWKLVPRVEPDPDFEAKKRQAESDAYIARLKAQRDALIAKIAEEKYSLTSKSGDAREWLMYLPSSVGSPEFIQRCVLYLEEMRTGRVEPAGGRMWLCKNHDCATRTFEISQFRVMDGACFCGGEFTALGRNLMHTFQGVSPDTITFAGNIELIAQVNRGAKGMSINDMPEEVQAADKGPGVLGLVGATCFALEPAYGRHGIYRLSNDKTTMIEMIKPATQ